MPLIRQTLLSFVLLSAGVGHANGQSVYPYSMVVCSEGSFTFGAGVSGSSDYYSGFPSLYLSGSAAATSALVVDVFRASVTSTSHGRGNFLFSAAAGYRDFVTAKPSTISPPVLRFYFSVSGDIHTSVDYNGEATGGVYISSGGNSVNELESYSFQNTLSHRPDASFTRRVPGFDPGNIQYSTGLSNVWDSASFVAFPGDPDTMGFRGTYHIDVAFNENTGGYRFATVLETASRLFGLPNSTTASVTSDFSHTGTLLGLGIPDGPMLSPDDFNFQSGMTFAAVPRPGSSLLLGAVVMGILGSWQIQRFRKKKEKVYR